MVFAPFKVIGRQSLGKPLTHGYAQSLVAAVQGSPSVHNHTFNKPSPANKASRPVSARLYSAFQNPSSAAGPSSRAPLKGQDGEVHADVGLGAYYDLWQKQQKPGAEKPEWKQFQFQKTIGWKPIGSSTEAKHKERDDTSWVPEASSIRLGLERAHSASTVDDLRKVAVKSENEDQLTQAIAINSAEAKAVDIANGHAQNAPVSSVAASINGASGLATSEKPTSSPTSTSLSDSFGAQSTTASEVSTGRITPAQDTQVQVAYQKELETTIASTLPGHEKAQNALQVYLKALEKGLQPNTNFYTSLIGLLCQRALNVWDLKKTFDTRRQRYGGFQQDGQFLLASNEIEYTILAEDDAINKALRMFYEWTQTGSHQSLSTATYQLLVAACAKHGLLEDMVKVRSHQEQRKVVPNASIFPLMIEAFGAQGDLKNAIDTYNTYRGLVIQDYAGKEVLVDRRDNDVYAAVVKAYARWNMTGEIQRFVSKITSSMQHTQTGEVIVKDLEEVIVSKGLIQERLEAKAFDRALQLADEHRLKPVVRDQMFAEICSAAADANNVEIASKASQSVSYKAPDTRLSMLALQIRLGNLKEARKAWAEIIIMPIMPLSHIEPTAMYAVAHIGKGSAVEGISEARQAFARIRSGFAETSELQEAKGHIDEAIELIGTYILDGSIEIPSSATVALLRTMMENGGLVSPIAENLMATLGSHNIPSLSYRDLLLTLESQAEMLKQGNSVDVAHQARFSFIVDLFVRNGGSVDDKTRALVDSVFGSTTDLDHSLVARWNAFHHQKTGQSSLPFHAPPYSLAFSSVDLPVAPPDPYVSTTDLRVSNMIDNLFEHHRPSASSPLDEALLRFKDCRRLGRHPRPTTYAKLIFNAAKDRRSHLPHELLAMFRADMAFIPGHPVSAHAHTVVLDSMLAAALTLNDRKTAAQCHQDILFMGGAPSANTYGLYITNLNSGQEERVFDEATEAVKIFERARTEGVELTSFLFNALIGKLSKARRIDDTLRYFHEMQVLNIRPTSVTYGTVISALCRVSNAPLAEMLFNEMEDQPNYRPRAAPYNSVMQFHLTTSLDSKAVLSYYNRMLSHNIAPTSHTFKLLIDTHATLSPTNISAAERILAHDIPTARLKPEATHFASLIHAKGCVHSDMSGALSTFESALRQIHPHPALYQALFESLAANHDIAASGPYLAHMRAHGVKMTPYIANALIKGWSSEKATPKGADVDKAKSYYDALGKEKREPSTYEAMVMGFLGVGRMEEAREVVGECMGRGYPGAVVEKVVGVLGM